MKMGTIEPLTRAIAFNNTIINSKRLAEYWNLVVESAIETDAGRPTTG